MFSNIKIKEAAIFAKHMVEGYTDEDGVVQKPISKEDVLEEIELIDNMLTVMKSRSLLNKKRGVKKMLDGILSISVKDEDVSVGGSNDHLLK